MKDAYILICVEYQLGFLCCHQDTSLNPQESLTELLKDLLLLTPMQPLHHAQDRFSWLGASYVSSSDSSSKEYWNLCKKSIAQLDITSQLKMMPSPSRVPPQKNKDISETMPAPPKKIFFFKARFKAVVVFTVLVYFAVVIVLLCLNT